MPGLTRGPPSQVTELCTMARIGLASEIPGYGVFHAPYGQRLRD
jgi:hypothetical protein